MKPLKPNEKLSIDALFDDLSSYRPKRRGWTWRVPQESIQYGPFTYHECSTPLKQSIPLPAAKYFGQIDPQPNCVITTEIASGRFEDDIRRMRMAAWHGADHLMVIRTAGQSHFDGLIEGTPEGIGGVPITRKQLRASRRALDLIEEEVGRPINFHSYVSGVAGPEVEAKSKLDPTAFFGMIKQVIAKHPQVKVVATTLREVHSTNRHDWSAVAWVQGQTYVAPTTALDVHDRIGGGDGFASGFFYGLLSGEDPQTALKLGWAHGALLTTFPGDTTMASLAEVRALAEGGSARVQR